MRKLLRVFLAFVMAFGVSASFIGCNGDSDAELTVWWPDMTDHLDTLLDSPVFQKLEENTGVKVKYIKEGTEEFDRRVRNGDYVDIMIMTGQELYPGGLDKAIDDGAFVDLTPYIDEFAPNYKSFLEISEQIEREAKTDGGKIGGMFGITDQIQGPWWGYVIRQDWLNILQADGGYVSFEGLPVTYDDWYEMLKGFKNHPSIKASMPLFLHSSGTDIFNFMNAGFNVGREFYQVDGTVKFGPIEAAFKDYLTLMNKWYSEGILKSNFNLSTDFLPSVPDAIGSTGKGSVGAFPAVYTGIKTNEERAAFLGNPNYELTPVPAPVLNEGDQLHLRQTNIHTGMVAVVTKACKDVEKAIKWLDYMYSEEGIELLNYGIEGTTFEYVDGEPIFTDLIKNNPDKLTLTEALYKYVAHSFIGNVEWEREIAVLSQKERDAMNVWSYNNDGAYLLTPAATMTPAEASDYATKFNALQTYITENIPKYIVGTKKLANYESDFIAGANANHVATLIAYKQASLNRYFAR